MFKNPGNKLRMLSEVAFIIFSIASIGYGISYISEGEVLIGLFTMGIGIFVSYVTGLLLCAFGRLVENSEKPQEQKKEEPTEKIISKEPENTDTPSNKNE